MTCSATFLLPQIAGKAEQHLNNSRCQTNWSWWLVTSECCLLTVHELVEHHDAASVGVVSLFRSKTFLIWSNYLQLYLGLVPVLFFRINLCTSHFTGLFKIGSKLLDPWRSLPGLRNLQNAGQDNRYWLFLCLYKCTSIKYITINQSSFFCSCLNLIYWSVLLQQKLKSFLISDCSVD